MLWLRFDHTSCTLHPLASIFMLLSSWSVLQSEKSWVIRSQSSKASKMGGLHHDEDSVSSPTPIIAHPIPSLHPKT